MRIRLLATILLIFVGLGSTQAQRTTKRKTARKTAVKGRKVKAKDTATKDVVTVRGFAMTTDHIPSADRRKDFNGSYCALVKVQVVDDIDRVEGNVIGAVVNSGVEKWVYMCKGSRNMRIHLKNHLPVRITFKDYNINGLESNRVYELTLDIPNATAQASVPEVSSNDLRLKVTPENATVYVWGDDLSKKAYRPQDDGTVTIRLPYGRYHYLAKADGYNDLEGSVFVNDENKYETVRLAPLVGRLYIKCETKNIDFYANGKLLDKERSAKIWSGELPVGKYTIEARKDGYETDAKDIEVKAQQYENVSFEKLVKGKGTGGIIGKLFKKQDGGQAGDALSNGTESQHYVLIGTEMQLISKGVLKGGTEGEVVINYGARDQFSAININKYKEQKLDSANPKILTPMPDNHSFHFEDNGDGTCVLVISDPETFWKASNYLVIQL